MTRIRTYLTTTALIALLAPAAAMAAPPAVAAPAAVVAPTAMAAPLAPPLAVPAAAAQPVASVTPAAAAAPPLAAADALTDIVVTAQRRSESVQNVPIAVSAFSAEQLEARGVTSTLQLINYVPNLFGSNNTGLGSANAYYIRGLGNTETIATFDPPVGTYVDDIYLSRQNANNFAFFDVQRIEVLRGPQGTLFGRNTTGGAVHVILKRPSGTLGGYIEAGYGSYQKKMVRGSVDVPFGEGIAVKISGYFQDDRGYAINTTTGERANDSDLAGLRGAVQFKATERLTWNLSAAYMRNDGENLLNFDCDPRNTANCKGRFITTGLRKSYNTAGSPSPFLSLGANRDIAVSGDKRNFGLGNKTDTEIYTSNIEYDFGDAAKLSLITGVVRLRQKYALDFADGRGLPNVSNPTPPIQAYARGGFDILNDGSHKQFTQEIKVNGRLFGGLIDYVTGVYFYDERNTTDFADVFSVGPGPTGTGLLLGDRTLYNTTKATAGYVQVDVSPIERVKLTAGVRYTDETKTFNIRDNRATCQVTPLPANCLDNSNLFVNLPAGRLAIPTSQTAKLWTPRFAANFKPTGDILIFASATRGFKSGGWNARGSANNTLLPFNPEKVWSYEVGGKTEFLDHRLRVNVTGFYLDTKQLQTPSAFIDPVSGAATFITQNFADYRNKGLELEISAVPFKGLSVYANAGYQDDKYKVSDTLLPNRFGVKAVRQQQLDCRAQLALGRVPIGGGAIGGVVNNAVDCAVGIVDARGNIATPVRTPKFSIAFGGSYDYAIPPAGIILTPSVNALYRSKLEVGTSNGTVYTGSITAPSGAVYPANPFGGNYIEGSLVQSFWQVQASLALRTDDGNWTLAVECENCFDKAYTQSSLVNYTYLSPPRTWQVRAKRVF